MQLQEIDDRLEALFPDEEERGRIRVVLGREPDKGFYFLADDLKTQAALRQLLSASGAAGDKVTNVLQALPLLPTPKMLGITWDKYTEAGHIRAYMPKAPPQPAALAHPVFARFLERIGTIELDQKTCDTAFSLSTEMTALSARDPELGNEWAGQRMAMFLKIVTPHLGEMQKYLVSSDEEYASTETKPAAEQAVGDDGLVPDAMRIAEYLEDLPFPCLVSQGRERWGDQGEIDPTFQNIGNYIQALNQLPQDHHILQNTVMPCLGLEVLETDLRITAFWLADTVCCEDLITVSMLHTPLGREDRLAPCLKNMALAVVELRAFYAAEAGAVAPAPGFHERGGRSCLPFQLRNYKHVQPLGEARPQRHVFRVTPNTSIPTIAKFVSQPYPEEIHACWAERDLVPRLLMGPESEIPRLVKLVWMEVLDPKDGWQLLSDMPTLSDEMEAALLAALTRLHEPLELAGSPVKCVHGDLRPGNIFVRERNGTCEVRFVDMDWAGPEGEDDTHRPAPVSMYMSHFHGLRQSNDTFKLQECISRRKQQPARAQLGRRSRGVVVARVACLRPLVPASLPVLCRIRL